MGQGRDNAKQFLREHPDAAKEIDAKLRETLALRAPAASEAEKPAAGEQF
jgi:recombination protein RecA